MTIINLYPNQIVYVIEGFEVVEATVIRVVENNQIILISEYTSFKERQKKYGIDFFLTKNKASKVLKDRLEKEKVFKNKRKIEMDKNKGVVKTEDKKTGEALREQKKVICNACGLPVGVFGHCGCSY